MSLRFAKSRYVLLWQKVPTALPERNRIKSIEQLRDELGREDIEKINADKYNMYSDFMLWCRGFDRRGEIDREEIEKLENDNVNNLQILMKVVAEGEKLKRVIEIQKIGLQCVALGNLDCFEGECAETAKNFLEEADAILNGDSNETT